MPASRIPSIAADDELNRRLKEIHKTFGRGSPLGRQLFNLYNTADNQYEPNVPVTSTKTPVDPFIHHRKLSLQKAAEKTPKPYDPAASMPRKVSEPVRIPRVFQIARRRSQKTIQAQTRASTPAQPVAGRQYIESSESKKSRLQSALSGADTATDATSGTAQSLHDRVSVDEQLVDTLTNELAALQSMLAASTDPTRSQVIQRHIEERRRDLHDISAAR